MQDTATSEWQNLQSETDAANRFAGMLVCGYFTKDKQVAQLAHEAATSKWKQLWSAVRATGRAAAAATKVRMDADYK